MKKTFLTVNDRKFPLYSCHTLLIGSGAAALNCACHLRSFGLDDLLIVTERLDGGVSANSGSDKQTYYKLSLFGRENDSVYETAEALFSGGAMHGDLALVEAALSAQEFYHLVALGVPFPHNRYGGYTGYKTDHDPKQRATSAGPWTSRQMHQKLLAEVRKYNLPVLDGHEVISLLTQEGQKGLRVTGALALDKKKADTGLDALVIFKAENIVLGTGGPGGLYRDSVYPEGYLGSTGLPLEAGATAANLGEWQYGLASTAFRWNVSGTYQQVIPRYISVKPDGSDEREFLNTKFPTGKQLLTAIFRKGYQWPFDTRKIEGYGSSLIDLLVYQETVIKGRRVFMDFRRNPSPLGGREDFRPDFLAPEPYEYLQKSGALQFTPWQRLEEMNPMALELYRQNGIDLTREPLEIAVCAQHHNGGIKGNIWWESSIAHLFPIGEVNGTHGVYRPGGSALNSGQVGGYRAAEYIANCYAGYELDEESFLRNVTPRVGALLDFGARLLGNTGSGKEMAAFRRDFQARMSRTAGHIRATGEVGRAAQEAERQYKRIKQGEVSLGGPADLVAYFQNRHLCLLQTAVLKSIENYLERGGGSRGSALVLEGKKPGAREEKWWSGARREAKELRAFSQEYTFRNGRHYFFWRPVREIPKDNFWFERVWSEYRCGDIYHYRK